LTPAPPLPPLPLSLAAGVLLTFGMGLFFIVFDFCSRRYAARVHHAATIATAHHATDREKIRGRHAFVAMVRWHLGRGRNSLKKCCWIGGAYSVLC
jgi:hypothetical protein